MDLLPLLTDDNYHKGWVVSYNRLIKATPEILSDYAAILVIVPEDQWVQLLADSADLTIDEVDSLFSFAYDARFWQNRLENWPAMKYIRNLLLSVNT